MKLNLLNKIHKDNMEEYHRDKEKTQKDIVLLGIILVTLIMILIVANYKG